MQHHHHRRRKKNAGKSCNGGGRVRRGRLYGCRPVSPTASSSIWTTCLVTWMLVLGGGPFTAMNSSCGSNSPQVGQWLMMFIPAASLAWALEVVNDDAEDTEEAPPHHHRQPPAELTAADLRLAESVKAHLKKTAASTASNNGKVEKNISTKRRVTKATQERLTLNQIFIKAGKRGLGGGIPGALAGAVQVISLMWLRTVINHQSRYGTTFQQSFRTLRKEGGVRRFYRGLGFALIQAPMSRFVSTAANDGVESFLASMEFTKLWGPGPSTLVASLVVGFWRMMLMPIDTCKTVLQVDSVEGFRSLMRRVKAGKIGVLYEGAIANALSSVVGHFPWFFVYNFLSKSVALQEIVPYKLLRNAGIGFVASIISDTVVNAIRVVKTAKQAMGSKYSVSYMEIINGIVAADGWRGLFGRGLQTRVLANALQSIIFTIIWRGLTERWQDKESDSSSTRLTEAAEKAR